MLRFYGITREAGQDGASCVPDYAIYSNPNPAKSLSFQILVKFLFCDPRPVHACQAGTAVVISLD